MAKVRIESLILIDQRDTRKERNALLILGRYWKCTTDGRDGARGLR